MFCPNCGFEDRSGSKFCKRCGTSLRVVADALAGKLSERQDDDAAVQRRIQEDILKDTLKRRRKLMSGGIISGCVGVGMLIMLSLIEGPETAVAGLIPLMIGVGLILSALLVYKPTFSLQNLDRRVIETKQPVGATNPQALPGYPESVTVETTRQLDEPERPRRIAE